MTTVIQDYIGPTHAIAGQPIAAVLKVFADGEFTAEALTVAVRDSAGGQLDFPSIANVQINQAGYRLTTAKQSFLPGIYTIFGAYQLNGVWRNLPSASMTISTP
ncbi:hypothetical protein [Kitasatospora sp. GP82]|uniref:hypothetical protein n=1 Tax=Kitasatospora sp. GP82 TaxID=3035089 RepID=UPI002474FD16|nr:hypothetical protein [Kitasatospora sp. GP82]MDH6126166.1 hypothetical protein [Kitasatospora sp. GP82]